MPVPLVPRCPVREMGSREFNQKTHEAKRAADEGPLLITDRGRPAYVLMAYGEYENLGGPAEPKSLADALVMEEDIELELPEREDWFGAREVDLE